ncbi:hypothetical protein VFPPC_07515 [Pochonia chlamydosporia 170]|uniref:Uncharacterized protein n=1 Tax=Pochonia chlamydosporia 170 TaxID=1380566 RepID=A0A179FJZ8_METCM|nr:hypothetical protein VFPPC_07515 [Pochonia chlamydosporia 170]OAQ65882.1 hypothetical protein VFPPC_07515 [Pochonia chlamydosporia 170]
MRNLPSPGSWPQREEAYKYLAFLPFQKSFTSINSNSFPTLIKQAIQENSHQIILKMKPTLVLALFTNGIFAATTGDAPKAASEDKSGVSAFNKDVFSFSSKDVGAKAWCGGFAIWFRLGNNGEKSLYLSRAGFAVMDGQSSEEPLRNW